MTNDSRNADLWDPAPPPPPRPPDGGWSPADPHHLGAPSAWPTFLVSVFFGPLGLVPALLHGKEARERGYDSRKYWMAFFLPVVVASVAFAVFVLVVLSVHSGSELDHIPSTGGVSGVRVDPYHGLIPQTLHPGVAPGTAAHVGAAPLP